MDKLGIITIFCALIGWSLLTWGLAELISVWCWALLYGILFLGIAGFRLIGAIMLDGIYLLMREDEDTNENSARRG